MLPLAYTIGIEPVIIVLIIVLVLFGGQKIPELLRGVGLGVGELHNTFGPGIHSPHHSTALIELAKGFARRARQYKRVIRRGLRSLLGLPNIDDDNDDSDDDNTGDGGNPPPPSAVRIWTHDELQDTEEAGAEPVPQTVGSRIDLR